MGDRLEEGMVVHRVASGACRWAPGGKEAWEVHPYRRRLGELQPIVRGEFKPRGEESVRLTQHAVWELSWRRTRHARERRRRPYSLSALYFEHKVDGDIVYIPPGKGKGGGKP